MGAIADAIYGGGTPTEAVLIPLLGGLACLALWGLMIGLGALFNRPEHIKAALDKARAERLRKGGRP